MRKWVITCVQSNQDHKDREGRKEVHEFSSRRDQHVDCAHL